MKNLLTRSNIRRLAAALAVTTLSGYVAQAHPYASGITNNGGTISFILNESADNVGLSFPDNHSTNNLGALAAGVHSFTLGAGTNHYAIYVSKAGTGTPSQISPTPTVGNSSTNSSAFFGPARSRSEHECEKAIQLWLHLCESMPAAELSLATTQTCGWSRALCPERRLF